VRAVVTRKAKWRLFLWQNHAQVVEMALIENDLQEVD